MSTRLAAYSRLVPGLPRIVGALCAIVVSASSSAQPSQVRESDLNTTTKALRSSESENLPLVTLISDVLLDKSTVCAGEPVKVSVRTVPNERVHVSINGAIGQYRILQFAGKPGKRRIRVVAAGPSGRVETAERQVEVIHCPGTNFPLLVTRPNPLRPNTIDFIVRQNSMHSSATGSYVWDFGDGSRTTTTVPFVSHYYGKNLDARNPYTQFEITLTMPSSKSVLRKSITVRNATYFTREKGFVRLSTVTSRSLRRDGQSVVGTYSIESVENERIEFREAREERRLCNPKARSSFRAIPLTTVIGGASWSGTIKTPAAANRSTSFIVGPREERHGIIALRAADVPSEICVIAFHLLGQTAGGLPARASLFFEARPNPFLSRQLNDNATSAFLAELVRRKLVPNPNVISEEDLRRLEWQGLIRRSPKGWEVQP